MNTSALASGSDIQHLSSFYRLLNQGAGTRSELDIMRVFVEVLAVWQDVESWAYVADVTGPFVLAASLPGTDRSRVPATIDASRLAADVSKPRRFSVEEMETLGFRAPADLLVSGVNVRGSYEWLIVSEYPKGAGAADADTRLGVYVQAVAQALNELHAVQSSRLTWAMLEHLLPAQTTVLHAAQAAMAEFAQKVNGATWLTVATDAGVPLLTAGDLMNGLSHPTPARSAGLLVVPVQAGAPYHAVMGLRRTDGPITAGDEQLLRLGASTLGTWLTGALPRLSAESDRRALGRSFDHLLKRQIDSARMAGEDVTVVVVALDTNAADRTPAHEYVARVRRELRPSDMAGRLSSGHVAVLLPETGSDQACAVVERLRRMFARDLGASAPLPSVYIADLPAAPAAPSA